MKEEEICEVEKAEILEEFNDIRNELIYLVTNNLNGPENEKLDLQDFYLDTALYNLKKQQNREDCKKTEIYLKALIVAQDTISQYLLKNYWETMEVKGKVMCGIFVSTMATKYTLLPRNMEKVKRLAWVEEQRRVEQFLCFNKSFYPWIIKTEE
ncbi:hypothetical protein NQ314_020154 [Rhamnusium bicolor]|uniref:Uncharacterized protein n=1 Tax=Rhamnusium bicolor TaxID=1586634 RepID=A0AAV8WLN4_9CUCU|nr:hypothetical protein NQ314_020154 [Rhamnusium bicolor]